jgi:hypothetical protein
MQELKPPCSGAIEEKNRDGSFRVRDAHYDGQLFTGVNVELDQSITISHADTSADQPWHVRHYVLDITRPTPRG